MESSSQLIHEQRTDDETAYLETLQLLSHHGVTMAVKAAIELDVFTILSRGSPSSPLSAAAIASEFPRPLQPSTPDRLDRLLRFLASQSILRCSPAVDHPDGPVERRYSLEPIYRLLARHPDGASLAPAFLFTQQKPSLDSWQYLKEAILEDVDPFLKANGMKPFEYMAKKDPKFGELFHEYMACMTKLTSEKIVDSYDGFVSVEQLVDVGGGTGSMLRVITAKYPNIKGINFDLPNVVSAATGIPRVSHVGGDAFVGIPRGDAVMLKLILHDWNDENCVRILRNCYDALPEGGNGKVIVVEQILPEIPERSNAVRDVYFIDLCMLVAHEGARERTEGEYRALAAQAGFNRVRVASRVMNYYVMEFLK
ncbi:hypothetical protein HPP92_020402 [Vanilla planifolia]|uniref:Uncharacterized protein n=1 Tax=Vanilla planifolia TaxID=51239 RepID=A0A835Q0M4_VANPL|nr:hypothetical protein HPP92_020402 [Vanilla planifolia]